MAVGVDCCLRRGPWRVGHGYVSRSFGDGVMSMQMHHWLLLGFVLIIGMFAEQKLQLLEKVGL